MSLGFFFNMDDCIGCRACQIACKDRNDLPVGLFYREVKSYEIGSYPSPKMYHYSAACNHCESPACVANCPTGSMQKDLGGDGTVQHDDDLCIGCGTCVKTCPYQIPVLLANKGIAGKCDACKPFRDADLNPVCVDACPMRCLKYGEISEHEQKYGSDLVNAIAPLPSPDTTMPNVRIKPKKAALESSFRQAAI